MVSYKICYTAETYNCLVDKITSFFTSSVQSCDSLLCSKPNEYWDIFTILFINYSLKYSSFYFDYTTLTKRNISRKLDQKTQSRLSTQENTFSLRYFIFY